MQLNKPIRPLRGRGRKGLAAATLGLLGAAAPAAHAQTGNVAGSDAGPTDKPWTFDNGLLVYSESGGRVSAVEPVTQATRSLEGDRTFSVKLVLDALTGASPNGATPASSPQTFSRPSGSGSTYTTDPRQLPLDDTFKDTRVALSGNYSFPVGPARRLDLGLGASSEYDFISSYGSVRFSQDLFQHNTTLSAGVNYELDQIKPVGGTPVGLSVLPAPGSAVAKAGDNDGKTVTDLVLGVTQVLDPNSLVQFNYSTSLSSGYHTDPYKILSVVDANGEPLRYVYERRPDSRNKQALFASYRRFMFARDVFDVSYRYLTDDWGVKSHTVDTTYRFNLGESNFVEPHLRYYTQTQPDFYHAALYDGEETTVDFASADPRLGAFNAVTAGLKYGHTFASGNQVSARLEAYQQLGQRTGVPAAAAAGLQKFDLEPDLSAAMLTIGYRFKW